MKRKNFIVIGLAAVVMLSGCSGHTTTETTPAQAGIQAENTQDTAFGESGAGEAGGNATESENDVSTVRAAADGEGVSGGSVTPGAANVLENAGEASEKSVVYMTTSITPEGLMAVYDALGSEVSGRVAVKLSMGEPGGHNFLSPDLIKDLVARVNGTIVDSNTAYGGRRASTELHRQVAQDHGFAAIAPIDILDAEGTLDLPVEGGKHLTRDIVGANLANYDSMLVLSHFKGHAMGGFGGALKNISIGIASSNGKLLIHSGGSSDRSWSGGTQDDFLESMAEASKAVNDYMGGKLLYINVMNNLSVDCDCDSNPAEPDMHDIGILASTDPVALDQACVDLVYAAEDGASLIERMESRNGILTVIHAEEMGLGSRAYTLVNIDEKAQEIQGQQVSQGVQDENQGVQEENQMKIQAGDREMTAVLADNSSAQALKELLKNGPLTIAMHDYAKMEKVGPIGQNLPTNDEQISTVPGDLILYQGNSLVIYYDTNAWNFTRIGKVQGVTQEELKEILGEGDVSVTFSLE